MAAAAQILGAHGETGGSLEALPMELAVWSSVRQAASQLAGRRLDLLVLNAGLVYHDNWKGPWLTNDGHDYLFATNHLGHFLLSALLLDQLKAAGGGRIIITSSIAHWAASTEDGELFFKDASLEHLDDGERRFRRSYARSKLCNLLHAYELQRRLRAAGSDVIVTPLTPGLVATEIFSTRRGEEDAYRHAPPALQQSAVAPSLGAATALHAATAVPAVPAMRWCIPYWTPPPEAYCCLNRETVWELEKKLELNQQRTFGVREAKTSPESYDVPLAQRVWAYSEDAVGLQSVARH